MRFAALAAVLLGAFFSIKPDAAKQKVPNGQIGQQIGIRPGKHKQGIVAQKQKQNKEKKIAVPIKRNRDFLALE